MFGYVVIGLVLAIMLGYILVSPKFSSFLGQKRTDRKRRRAHDGKLTCEETSYPCSKIAVRLTPNGYFCEDHWEARSKRMLEGGGHVRWSHILYHSVRRG